MQLKNDKRCTRGRSNMSKKSNIFMITLEIGKGPCRKKKGSTMVDE